MPFKEDLAVNTPISPYAATKKAAEVMAYTYHRQYNIDVSINQFIQWIEQLTGKKARINHQPVHSADMASTRANIQKAQTLLGWQPQTSTYEGLKNIVSQPKLLRFNC